MSAIGRNQEACIWYLAHENHALIERVAQVLACPTDERLESSAADGRVKIWPKSVNLTRNNVQVTMRAELYQAITKQILASIEAGAAVGTYERPWHQTGRTGLPINAISRRQYRGINTLLLWAAAGGADYDTGEWATYRQWIAAGAQVRKGERATTVLLWKSVGGGADDTVDVDNPARNRMVARAFGVFNLAQVDGYATPVTRLSASSRMERAEAFFAAQPAAVWHGSDCAFFDPLSDTVSLPPFTAFKSAEAFYSVYAHELTHWTGVKSRLDRDLSGRFGSEAYAMEELVAELGAAFTLGHLGLSATPRDDHARYIASWLNVLRGDARAIITAASQAQVAADYLAKPTETNGPTDSAVTLRSELAAEA